MTREDEQRQLEHARRALVTEFAGQVEAAQVEQAFQHIVARYSHVPVRSFVPVLALRQARRDLRSTTDA